jgi:hypothetical protein
MKRNRPKKDSPAEEKEKILFDRLSDTLRNNGFEIRIEKGDFRGGVCTVQGDKRILFLNKKHPIEKINNIMLGELKSMSHQQLYLPPKIRPKIEGNKTNQRI